VKRAPAVFALLAILAVLSACADGDGSVPGASTTGVRGVVLLGPMCPVETPTSPCPDRPMTGTDVEVLRGGDVVARVTTDAEGRFEVPVPSGDYSVRAVLADGGPGMSVQPVDVTVTEGSYVEVTVSVDSGIR